MTGKLLFVDVGTHAAQEYMGLFGHGRTRYLREWLRHRRRARRHGNPALGRKAFFAFLATTDAIKNLRHQVIYVMVEPNARLFAQAEYRNADLAFNIALSADPETASVMPLYLADGNQTGQGSSLFEAKPNVALGEFDLVLNIDALHFAKMLDFASKTHAAVGQGPVVLRLNNEGAEVEVIHAFQTVFGPRLQIVMGSLSDVAKVKGDAALTKLHAFLGTHGIPFLPLHSDFATWPRAAEMVLSLLQANQAR